MEQYKVILVDDEVEVIDVMKKKIRWNDLGFDVVGSATNGVKALELVEKLQPDVVLMDIKMPYMDGLELARKLNQDYPNIYIMLCTGFDEFEYAKQCIGLGITDYLLKPIVRTDIREACQKAIRELDALPAAVPEQPVLQDVSSDMEHVKQYIDNHYPDSALNLTAIAQKFGYNPSYLSRRFKADCGQNISDYITACRMEKAKKCLESRMLMYMTAKEVGIPDPNYFGKCFKKYTGSSYSELLKLQLST